MSGQPAFASVPLLPDSVQVTVANTNRDGTGTLVALTTGPTGGVRLGDVIEQVIIQAAGVVSDGMIRFFLSKDGGTTKRLVDEVQVSSLTPSGTTPAFRNTAPDLVGMVLANDQAILYAATNNAETFNIIVQKSGVPT